MSVVDNPSVVLFAERLQTVGGECHLLAGAADVSATLKSVVNNLPPGAILLPPDPELRRLKVAEILTSGGFEVLVAAEAADQAGVGITTALAGIADTGTVVLAHDRERGRLAALLPPVHLVLLRRDQVYADKITFLAAMRNANFDLSATPMTWVTGPSSTADIEKVLVRGAHGPRRLIAILY